MHVRKGAGIRETGRSTEESGAKRRLVGSNGELERSAERSRSSASTTIVDVIPTKNTVEYDKDVAKELLRCLVARQSARRLGLVTSWMSRMPWDLRMGG